MYKKKIDKRNHRAVRKISQRVIRPITVDTSVVYGLQYNGVVTHLSAVFRTYLRRALIIYSLQDRIVAAAKLALFCGISQYRSSVPDRRTTRVSCQAWPLGYRDTPRKTQSPAMLGRSRLFTLAPLRRESTIDRTNILFDALHPLRSEWNCDKSC